MKFSNILKGFLLSAGALMCTPQVDAQQANADDTKQWSMVVELKSGATEKFVLAEKPVVTFSDTECIFTV